MANLAILNGAKVRKKPFAPWPVFAEDEIAAAVRVLQSGKVNYWTGEEGRAFEQEFASYCGVKHAIALANGTLALELALHALNIGPGDEVIVPSRTFIATASAVVARGAKPVVVDIDPNSQNLTAQTVQAALTSRTRAVIAVHFAGWPCDMNPLMQLAHRHNLKVIEDCAQAHGAVYDGRKVGSIGHAGAFSFCQDKILTTAGEGGMLTTNDDQLWQRAWSYKDHGKNFQAAHEKPTHHGFRFLHDSFGSNFRLTEVQAAIGRIALRKLEDWLSQRRDNAAYLSERLANIPGIRVAAPEHHMRHAHYKFYAQLNLDTLREGWSQARVIEAINAEGVPCFSGSCAEIYREQAFPEDWRPAAPLKNAAHLGITSLMFQVHPTLRQDDMMDVADAVAKVMAVASRA